MAGTDHRGASRRAAPRLGRRTLLGAAVLLLAAALVLQPAAAAFRAAEDYRISIMGELTGLTPPHLNGGSAADGRPPAHSTRHHRGTDPLGAEITASHDVHPREEVVVLDHHEGVLAVDCAAAGQRDGTLTLRVASATAFLNHLPHAALFVLGAGWGCVGTLAGEAAPGGGGGFGRPLGVELGHEGIAALEPDGSAIYLRAMSVIFIAASSSPPSTSTATAGDVLVFNVTEVGLMDLYHSADILYTRHLDPTVAERNMAAAMAARESLSAAFSNASAGASAGRRRLTWTAAYESVRHDDDSDAAAFAQGLTPHARGRRRLESATRALQSSIQIVNGATGFTFPCILSTGIVGPSSFAWSSMCIWGLEYTYQYTVRRHSCVCRPSGRVRDEEMRKVLPPDTHAYCVLSSLPLSSRSSTGTTTFRRLHDASSCSRTPRSVTAA
jgi:hypothetical protein